MIVLTAAHVVKNLVKVYGVPTKLKDKQAYFSYAPTGAVGTNSITMYITDVIVDALYKPTHGKSQSAPSDSLSHDIALVQVRKYHNAKNKNLQARQFPTLPLYSGKTQKHRNIGKRNLSSRFTARSAGFGAIGDGGVGVRYQLVRANSSVKSQRTGFNMPVVQSLRSLMPRSALLMYNDANIFYYRVEAPGDKNDTFPYLPSHPYYDVKNPYAAYYKKKKPYGTAASGDSGAPLLYVKSLKKNYSFANRPTIVGVISQGIVEGVMLPQGAYNKITPIVDLVTFHRKEGFDAMLCALSNRDPKVLSSIVDNPKAQPHLAKSVRAIRDLVYTPQTKKTRLARRDELLSAITYIADPKHRSAFTVQLLEEALSRSDSYDDFLFAAVKENLYSWLSSNSLAIDNAGLLGLIN